MNEKTYDSMFTVDIDFAIEMLKAKRKCLSKRYLISFDLRCDEKCEKCELAYAQGNIGSVKKMCENVVEWLEELKELRGDKKMLSSFELIKKHYDLLIEELEDAENKFNQVRLKKRIMPHYYFIMGALSCQNEFNTTHPILFLEIMQTLVMISNKYGFKFFDSEVIK